jgi:hypothetical protein
MPLDPEDWIAWRGGIYLRQPGDDPKWRQKARPTDLRNRSPHENLTADMQV